MGQLTNFFTKHDAVIETQPSAIRQLVLFVLGWAGLQAIAITVSVTVRAILSYIYTNPIELANALGHISYPASINIISYVILLVVLVMVDWDTLKKLLPSFIRLSVVFKGIGYGALILLAGIALNSLYLAFGIDLSDNANESSITAIMRNYPFFSIIAFVIAGPICEEITYRLGLFGLLRHLNRYVAYAVTFLFFGLIHFDFDTTNMINELLNLPFYIIAGLIFCYIYEREGLATSIYAHITNNLVSFITSFLSIDLLARII